MGNEYYNNKNLTGNFTIAKETHIVKVETTVNGFKVNITANVTGNNIKFNGTVKIYFDGKYIGNTTFEGKANYTINNVLVGNHTVTVEFIGMMNLQM